MSLTAKVGAGFAVLVALMAVLSWSQLAVIDRLHAESRKLSQVSFEAASLGLRLRADVARVHELSRKFLVLRDPAYAAEADKLRREIEAGLARLGALELDENERRVADRLEASWQAYRAAAEPQPGDRPSGLRVRLDESFDALDGELRRLVSVARAAMASRVAASDRRVERARWIAWGGTAAGLLAAAFLALAIVRSLVRPLQRLGHGTRVLAEGDFTHQVPPEGGLELAALAEDFNAMARQLSQLDQLKKDFLANVSHDLKSPLASMQESTRLLLEGIPGPLTDRQRRLLSLNLKSGERLFRLIEDLLHLSRLEAGSMDYSPRRQDLVGLARTALDEIGGLVADGKLEVETDFPGEPVVVACDGSAILKVFHNLLSNAIKYSSAGGTIGVGIRRLETRAELPPAMAARWPGEKYMPAAEIEIRDSGPGIPDDHKRRIFGRFYRIDDKAAAGTGLGLAIVHEIVAGHGGEVWVEDGAEGGSVFRAVLWARPPVEDSSPETVPERGSDGVRPRGAARAAAGLLALGLLCGCRGMAPKPVAVKPAAAKPDIVEPAAEEPGVASLDVASSFLEIGDAAFDRGDFQAARTAYEAFLESGPTHADDRVLFRLALMHVLPASTIRDSGRFRELVVQLVERFPESPYRAAAEYLRVLQREVAVLRRQLDEIKRIDLAPGPPPPD